MTVTVVVAEDYQTTRQGLKTLLERDRKIKVIDEAEDCDGAVESVTQLKPDVLLLDIRLNQSSGLEAAKALKSQALGTKILILSAYDDFQYVKASIKLGVYGYMLKSSSAKEIRNAIHHVASGGIVFPADISGKVFDAMNNNESETLNESRLTGKEIEVLEYLAKGLANRDIAQAMNISEKTVEIHMEHILSKLSVKSRTQALLKAIATGSVKLSTSTN